MSKSSAAWSVSEKAASLHREALVWDNHGCMPTKDTERFLVELEQYRRAGVDVAMINIGDADFPLATLVQMAARIRGFVSQHPDRYVMASSANAILEARAQGKLAVGLDIEGVYSIGTELRLIQLFYDLGVRWTLIAYNRANLAGSGCHDEVDNGLTDFGRELVREMDRVGMVKCCTHTGYRTALDVLTMTDKPSIFSHSNPRALRDHPRNIPDELIDACAATGGVVCINGIGIFLGDNDVRVSTFVDHVDYVRQRVGVDHVGIGLDFVFDQSEMEAVMEQKSIWPAGFGYDQKIRFLGPDQLPHVTEEMLRRGFSDDEARAVLGGNLLRVAREVWR